MEKTEFQVWLETKGYKIEKTVHNEDGTVKTEGTSAQEVAGYFIEHNAEKREEIKAAMKAENEELVKELTSKLHATQQEQGENLAKIISAVSEMGVALKRLNDIAEGDVSMTNTGSLDTELKSVHDDLKSMRANNDGKVQIKVAGNMTISGNISGGDVPQAMRESGVNNIAKRRTFIRSLVNNATTMSNVVEWVEQQNQDGAVGGTAEGTLKNKIDFDLVVVSENVKKRTGFIKISTEMLDDIDFMRSEIDNELFTELDLDIDDQILNGDDTGQNLNGILTQATTWAAGAFALTVNQANLVDVLTVAATQIEVANHMATVHVVNPIDLTTLRLIKAAADVQYVDRLLMVNGTLTLDGIPVVSNTGIAQDTFLTMDGSKDTVFSKGEITIQIGLDSDDFTKNMRTILAEWRWLNRIKGNDTTAFVTGTVSTAIAALETV